MKNSLNSIAGRLVRPFLLGSVVMAAAAAVVVLGDNGVKLRQQQQQMDEPEPEQEPEEQPDLIVEILPQLITPCGALLTNVAVTNLNMTNLNEAAIPALIEKHHLVLGSPNDACAVDAVCSNKWFRVGLTFTWCCKPPKDCVVQFGGKWMNLSAFKRLGVTGCITKVECN